MARLTPAERAELTDAYRKLAAAVGASTAVISGKFRPSSLAAMGLLLELGNALRGGNLIAKVKTLAPSIGPHVTALVQAL